MAGVNSLIVLVAVMASLLEIIDTSIVNVAVPTMMGNLGATLENISWVVTGYIIANAIVLPLAGWLSLQIGRKTYYTGCILLFTAASVGCGLSPNLSVLIAFRVLQGLAGGALLPTSQALIMEAFPREKAGMASAIYGMSVMIGPTAGPILGGYLTDNYGWRTIFNVNLPLGLVTAVLSYLYVGDAIVDFKSPARSRSIDYVGLMLLVAGIGCFQYVLERGEADDWFSSSVILGCTVVAALAIPGFVAWELKTPHPIVDLRLFKTGAIRYGTMIMGTIGSMLYSLIFFVPIFGSTVLGLTATQTGAIFIPGALASAALMPVIGAQLQRRDPRTLLAGGFAIFGFSLLLFSQLSPLNSADDLFWPLFYRGAAMAFLFVPINSTVLSQFSGAALGQAAGLMNLSRQLGGSIGIALYSTLLTSYRAQFRSDLTSRVSLLDPQTRTELQASAAGLGHRMAEHLGFADGTTAALKSIFFRVERQVFVLSFDKVMLTMLLVSLLAMIPVYFLRAKGPLRAVDAH